MVGLVRTGGGIDLRLLPSSLPLLASVFTVGEVGGDTAGDDTLDDGDDTVGDVNVGDFGVRDFTVGDFGDGDVGESAPSLLLVLPFLS